MNRHDVMERNDVMNRDDVMESDDVINRNKVMMRLRPYEPADSKYLLWWLQDERTVNLWKADRFTWPLTQQQLEQYFEDFKNDPCACMFTALNEEGVPCGHFSFRQINFHENSAHMGFIVVDPSARGMGYGRQMVSQALKYAFEILLLNQVTLGVYDCNEAAKRCYEAIGFKETDRKHHIMDFYGERWEYYYLTAKCQTP